VGEIDTDFTDEVMKKFIVDLRKKAVTRWSLDVAPEEMLEVFCSIDAGKREVKKCKVYPCTGTEALYRPYGP